MAYYKNDKWDQCYEINEIETLIFEVMKKVAVQYGLKTSLKDIPKVFGYDEVATKKMFYPLYSICKAGNIYLQRLVKYILIYIFHLENH